MLVINDDDSNHRITITNEKAASFVANKFARSIEAFFGYRKFTKIIGKVCYIKSSFIKQFKKI